MCSDEEYTSDIRPTALNIRWVSIDLCCLIPKYISDSSNQIWVKQCLPQSKKTNYMNYLVCIQKVNVFFLCVFFSSKNDEEQVDIKLTLEEEYLSFFKILDEYPLRNNQFKNVQENPCKYRLKLRRCCCYKFL